MRNYKRKRPRQWRDKDKRMTLAAQMRGGGMSLREIAKELAVGVATIHRDLARWDELSNVVPLFHSGVPSCPAGGEMEHPDGTAETPVSMINRRRAQGGNA